MGAANGYVKAVTLNGKPLTRAFLTHEELMKGGELHFEMSTKADARWSMQPLEMPYSMTPKQ
jgi:putative alpha-1,2-mannosidase